MKTSYLYIVCVILITGSFNLFASESNIPEPFRGESKNSDLVIDYDELNYVLSRSVVRTGPSTREPEKSPKFIGTRMRTLDDKLTSAEGNRFFFEAFDDKNKHVFALVKEGLEQLPTRTPLKLYSKNEQLAYWLNLYNTTLINELLAIYPKKNLETFLHGDEGVLNKKLISIAGHKLSLNDVQYNILFNKYDKNPLIMYGLFQGVIGSPDIRYTAYTGANVWQSLEENASQFINSNRGTYVSNRRVVKISSMYDRNSMYFESQNNLTDHLLTYVTGETKNSLQEVEVVKATIVNWSISDIHRVNKSYTKAFDNRIAQPGKQTLVIR